MNLAVVVGGSAGQEEKRVFYLVFLSTYLFFTSHITGNRWSNSQLAT